MAKKPPAAPTPMHVEPITSGWISWRPLMVHALANTQGPVLELGAGDGSTPFLHALCSSQVRTLVTVDSNPGWVDRFREHEGPMHRLEAVASWDALDLTPPGAARWGCVLVDHAPGERRVEEIRRLKDLADVLVIHDTEPTGGGNYGYASIWGLFRFIRHDNPVGGAAACATAVSNFLDPNTWTMR